MAATPKKHPEYKIIAELLEMASDEFSNHSCNDYEIDNTAENMDLLKDAHNWNVNGDPSQSFEPVISKDGSKIYVMDYFLFGYFAHIFRDMTNE
jgi:hypothetical protein